MLRVVDKGQKVPVFLTIFIIKFGYSACCHWLKESIEYRAELKLSRHLPNCTMFDLFLNCILPG